MLRGFMSPPTGHSEAAEGVAGAGWAVFWCIGHSGGGACPRSMPLCELGIPSLPTLDEMTLCLADTVFPILIMIFKYEFYIKNQISDSVKKST